MRTEPFVIDVTVTGFISRFICGPQMLKFYTFWGAGESIGGRAGPTRGTGNSNTGLDPVKKHPPLVRSPANLFWSL